MNPDKRKDLIEAIVYGALSWDGLETSGVPAEEIAADVLKVIEKFYVLVEKQAMERPGG